MAWNWQKPADGRVMGMNWQKPADGRVMGDGGAVFYFLMDFFFWKKIYKTMVWHGNLAKTTITQKFTIQRYSK